MELDDTIYKELLGLCLVDSSLIPYITTKIQIEDIPKGIYRIIYTAISELYNLGVDIDIVTVSNRLLNTNKLKEIGGRAVINNLALDAPQSRFVRKIVEEVVKQNTFRQVTSIVDNFQKDIKESDNVNTTCLDYCSKISSVITGNIEGDNVTTISSGADDVINDL